MKPVRFSHLKHMSRSAAHCRHAMESGWEDTLAMRVGSGTHALLFDQPVAIYPGKVRNGKAWEAFEEENAGRCILNQSEHAKAEAIADAIGCNRQAFDLLFGGDVVHEQTIIWDQLGRACSGTPDVRSDRYIVDLKTTKCADPQRFTRDATFRSYHAQLAWYLDGVVASGLGTPSEAYIVAVESTPPHCVTVLRLTDNAIDQGRRQCRVWFERFLSCERDDVWPGYVESVVDFDIETELELTGFDDDEPGSIRNALRASMGEVA